MREFFRGWKRKLGVTTLFIACLFAAGWVRSYSFDDEFDALGHMFLSVDGNFYELKLTKTVSIVGGRNVAVAELSPLWRIPYWSVVLPLALLSGWLLLSNSRSTIQTKTTEPPPTHGESHA